MKVEGITRLIWFYLFRRIAYKFKRGLDGSQADPLQTTLLETCLKLKTPKVTSKHLNDYFLFILICRFILSWSSTNLFQETIASPNINCMSDGPIFKFFKSLLLMYRLQYEVWKVLLYIAFPWHTTLLVNYLKTKYFIHVLFIHLYG